MRKNINKDIKLDRIKQIQVKLVYNGSKNRKIYFIVDSNKNLLYKDCYSSSITKMQEGFILLDYENNFISETGCHYKKFNMHQWKIELENSSYELCIKLEDKTIIITCNNYCLKRQLGNDEWLIDYKYENIEKVTHINGTKYDYNVIVTKNIKIDKFLISLIFFTITQFSERFK